MKDRTGPDAAAQEAFEEAGLRGAVARAPLGAFTYLKRFADGSGRLCAVKVFPRRYCCI